MNKLSGAFALSGCLALSGCKGIKYEDLIEPISGIAGGIIGYYLCSDEVKVLCSAAGATLGAWAGSAILRELNEDDLEKREEAIGNAIASGDSQVWSNKESGNGGSVTVEEKASRESTTKVRVLKERVTEIPSLVAIGEPYRFTSNANVRGGPGTEYEKVYMKPAGEVVEVIGKVRDKSWYFIGEYDTGTGFVYQDLLRPVPLSEQVVKTENQRTPFPESSTTVNEVAYSAECVAVIEEISVGTGEAETRTSTLCRSPEGWEVV